MKRAKKRHLALCLSLAVLMACAFTATAADTAAYALGELSFAEGYKLQPLDAAGNAIEAVDGEYSQVEKLSFSFASQEGEEYVAFLLYDSSVPTESSIRYINQLSGTGAELSFTLYPGSMAQAGSYYVYLSDSESYTQIGSFTVSQPPYITGDVDGSGEVDVGDATRLLRYLAQLTGESETVILPAADIDGSGEVDVGDVTRLLRVLAGLESL